MRIEIINERKKDKEKGQSDRKRESRSDGEKKSRWGRKKREQVGEAEKALP